MTSEVGGDQKLYENHVFTKIGQCVSVSVRVEGGGCVSNFFFDVEQSNQTKGEILTDKTEYLLPKINR